MRECWVLAGDKYKMQSSSLRQRVPFPKWCYYATRSRKCCRSAWVVITSKWNHSSAGYLYMHNKLSKMQESIQKTYINDCLQPLSKWYRSWQAKYSVCSSIMIQSCTSAIQTNEWYCCDIITIICSMGKNQWHIVACITIIIKVSVLLLYSVRHFIILILLAMYYL